MAKKVVLLTNNPGCSRNVNYYSKLKNYFMYNGWSIITTFDNPDLVVYIGCGFHHTMKDKITRTFDKLLAQGCTTHKFLVLGCITKTHMDDIKNEYDGEIRYYKKDDEEQGLDDFINAQVPFDSIKDVNILDLMSKTTDDPGLDNKPRQDTFNLYISKGCRFNCTYCIGKKARGYIKSQPMEDVLKQYEEAIKLGKRNINLSADDAFGYGFEKKSNVTIETLIDSMLKIDDNIKLQVEYMHPFWIDRFGNYVIELIKRGLLSLLTISIQHVNKEMLKRMGRPVDFETTYNFVKKVSALFPDFPLNTELIIGFPGETNEIFNELITFLKNDTCFHEILHYPYSDNKGTKSYMLPDKVKQYDIVFRWERVKRVLGKRSPFNQPESLEQKHLDLDYYFC